MDSEFEAFHCSMLILNQEFREAKHAVNNSLAVMMALAELAKRNPEANTEKFISAVLTRGQDIVDTLSSFSREFTKTVTLPE